MKLRDIASLVGGQIIGNPDLEVKGFAPAYAAKLGELTFAENESYFRLADQSDASAILVDALFATTTKTLVQVPSARIAFAKILPLFFPETEFAAARHETAVIAATAEIDPTAHVGPWVYVGDKARIGARVVIEAGSYVGAQCNVGAGSHIFPRVTLYPNTSIGQRVRLHAGAVIGSDGFGYVMDAGAHRKVPQVGHVIIQDDVEIGANTTVDRGALGPTVIGRGTKIDNLVQLGHNVVTGEHCIIVSQVGVAGSTKMGSYVTIAGQAGIAGHLKLGSRTTIAAQSGVMNHIPDGEKWFGSPARPDRQMKRQLLAMQQLPELIRRVAELERRLLEQNPSEIQHAEQNPATENP